MQPDGLSRLLPPGHRSDGREHLQHERNLSHRQGRRQPRLQPGEAHSAPRPRPATPSTAPATPRWPARAVTRRARYRARAVDLVFDRPGLRDVPSVAQDTLTPSWDKATCAQGGCHTAGSSAPQHAAIDTAHIPADGYSADCMTRAATR